MVRLTATSAVVAHVDGGADQITWKLDGAEDTRVKRLFDRYGIRY